MVHDLTVDELFQDRDRYHFIGNVNEKLNRQDTHWDKSCDEIVLTGTAGERQVKRYIVDYESDDKNICDCCGGVIRTKPWDYENFQTLCPSCEEYLNEQYGEKPDETLLKRIDDIDFDTRITKPWDMYMPEREQAVDNVFLWD